MHLTITDRGAVADGRTLATAAIQGCVDAVAREGGGRVIIPPGRFLTGMIRLKDHVNLHLEAGSTLIASPVIDDHLPLLDSGGTGDHWRTGESAFHLIAIAHCRDVSITGTGTLDGNGPAWYDQPADELSWPLARDRDWRRPGALVQVHASRDVRIRDVTIGNVANWTLHLHESDRVLVHGVRIDSPATAPNADGIDITGCRSVTISDCHIDTCDDAVCLKSLPNGRSCEDVAVTNCILRTHCVALKLGCGESFQDMRNVVFANCVVRGSHRAVGLYSLGGAVVENIAVENIVCDTRAPLMFPRPIHIDLRQRAPQSRLGAMRNIRIAGLMAETTGRCLITAQAGAAVEDVILRDVVLRYPVFDDPAIRGAEVGGGQFSNANPWARVERAALVVENARNLVVEGLTVRWPSGPAPEAWRFPIRIANGTHRRFVPADWELAPGTPVAAVSLRNVLGGRLDARGLDGLNGAPPVLTDR